MTRGGVHEVKMASSGPAAAQEFREVLLWRHWSQSFASASSRSHPYRPFDSMRALWQLPNWNCHGVNSGDGLLLPCSLLAHATGFVAQELLVIVQIAVERLDATLGDEPELVTYRAQQGPVVTDQQHCAFEFVEGHA